MRQAVSDRVVASQSIFCAPVLLAGVFVVYGSAALAQAFPAKPVRFLSGQPPGGATDLFARMVAQKLNESWKQPVIVEHRPGASGSIAAELTAKAPPDGHMLLFSTAGQIVMNPHLMKLNYDPVTDLAPVAFLVHTSMLLGVTSSKRLSAMPDIPTMSESGFPQIGSTAWYGALAPGKTPASLVSLLSLKS